MNKKIRLTTAFILTVVMAFSASVSVFAESIYANIDSARVSIKIPEEFTVTSSELNPDDEITYSAEAAMSDTAKQLSIKSSKSAYSTDIYNFKYLTEEQIKSELSAIKSSGATFSGEIFKNVSNAAFKETPEYILFSLYYSSIQNNTTVNYAVAYTLVNGEYIKIKYSSASGFDNKDMEIFQSIIDSVYVQALYDKPEKVNMPGILHTMFIAVIIIALLISGCLALYYVKKKSSIIKAETAKRRRKLSDKYFNELKNEGLMEDTKAEAEEFISENINNTETVIEPSENVRPRNPEEISAIIEEAARNPSLIQDEWEDVDIKTIQEKKGHPEITCAKCGECVSVCPNKAISYDFRFNKNKTACACSSKSKKPRTAAGRVIQQLLHPANLFRFAAFTFAVVMSSDFMIKSLNLIAGLFGGAK